MSPELKRQLIDRMRTVQHLLDCHSERPGGAEPADQVIVQGESMGIVEYGQRLSKGYADEDEDEAKRLLAVLCCRPNH